MALLAEYALTPDVFDSRSYPHEEVGSARIDLLRDVLLEEALVRDLRQGDWLSVFGNPDRSWNRRGLELLKKVAKQNRLRRVRRHSLMHQRTTTAGAGKRLHRMDSIRLPASSPRDRFLMQPGGRTFWGVSTACRTAHGGPVVVHPFGCSGRLRTTAPTSICSCDAPTPSC